VSKKQSNKGKHVTFNDTPLNVSSLDESLIERIFHNQKYNDDTIFDNFSIFHQLQKEEIKSKDEPVVSQKSPPQEKIIETLVVPESEESNPLPVVKKAKVKEEEEKKRNVSILEISKNEGDSIFFPSVSNITEVSGANEMVDPSNASEIMKLEEGFEAK
jgi:hypothetical protein